MLSTVKSWLTASLIIVLVYVFYCFYFYTYGTFFLGSTFPFVPTTVVGVVVLPVFLITDGADTTGDRGVPVADPVLVSFGVLVTVVPTGFFSPVVGALVAVVGALVVVPVLVPVVGALVPVVVFF